MTESIGKAKLWMSDCGRSDDDDRIWTLKYLDYGLDFDYYYYYLTGLGLENMWTTNLDYDY